MGVGVSEVAHVGASDIAGEESLDVEVEGSGETGGRNAA